MLNQIEAALKTICDVVVYGTILPKDLEGRDRWEFIVFRRSSLVYANGRIYQQYEVSYCDEEYIREGIEEDIINAMKTLNIFQDKNSTIDYDVVRKGDTNARCEIVTITFKKKIGEYC